MPPLIAEVMQTMQALPPEQQQQVLDFVKFLEQKLEQNRPTQNQQAGALSKLKQIKIQAPADFAENLDRYLSGEQTVG
ncbi:MAG: DUF2281 domain-containing protein [Elainella sp.]